MADNSQIAHINSMLRSYQGPSDLSRALTQHCLGLDQENLTNFALAMIMQVAATQAVKQNGEGQ